MCRKLFTIIFTLGIWQSALADECPPPKSNYGIADRERYLVPLDPLKTDDPDCQVGQEIDSVCFNFETLKSGCKTMAEKIPLSCSGTVTGLSSKGSSHLSVRTGPSTTFKTVGKLNNGHELIVTERLGNWFSVVVTLNPNNENYRWETAPECEVHVNGKIWVHRNWVNITGVWSP